MKRRVLFCFGIIFVAGCSRGQAVTSGPPEGDVAVLRNLVTRMPDESVEARTFRAAFAKGETVPPESERARFGRLYFDPVGDPKVEGDTASVKVSVRDDEAPAPLGQVDWTFVKEGEQWKLKSAPLPASN
jgi:hypothetical protein